jgi:hypothetical protein
MKRSLSGSQNQVDSEVLLFTTYDLHKTLGLIDTEKATSLIVIFYPNYFGDYPPSYRALSPRDNHKYHKHSGRIYSLQQSGIQKLRHGLNLADPTAKTISIVDSLVWINPPQ